MKRSAINPTRLSVPVSGIRSIISAVIMPILFMAGIMDAFRQPKASYYMFMSQRSPEKSDLITDNGPMIYIAHEA